MDKITEKAIKEFTIRKGTKEYIIRRCSVCGWSNRRFVICHDESVNIVTSCGCSPIYKEYPTSWKKVADWVNGEIVI